jgi:exodeoxyribonuclease VII large subunit
MSHDKKIFTLSQLNTSLENFILTNFGSKQFWVTAEITKISKKNGHRYLELADSSNGALTAQQSAYIWMRNYTLIQERIGADIDTILQPGNNALFLLKIEFHTIFGLKLNILDIDPTYTYGEIERKKQATIQQLKTEGLFYNQKALHLPVLSKRIAVIGSPDTSGFRDFMNEIQHNNIYNNFTIQLFPASVQGQKATSELIQAVKEAQTYTVDVIVIIRGGGSKMDLALFNDYELCKTICLSKTPILTGIGHETDEVVADLVSRLNCITPTAVAKHLYIQIGVFSSSIRTAFDSVLQRSLSLLGSAKDEFSHTSKYIVHNSQRILTDNRNALERKTHQFHLITHDIIYLQYQDLELLLQKGKGAAIHKLRLTRDIETPAHLDRIALFALNSLKENHISISNLEHLLTLLNPEKLLQSGYTLSTIDNTDLYLITQDLIGKEMKTLTSHALITSKITDFKPLKNGK